MKAVAVLLSTGLIVYAAARQGDVFNTSAGPLKITPIQHASLMIEAGGKVIQVDPVNPPYYKDLPAPDLILITDIHADHLSAPTVGAIRKPGTVIIAPEVVVPTVPDAQVLANGQTKKWNDFTIEAIPMYNLTRGPKPGQLFHDKGRGNGYVITFGGKRIYISGDTEGIPEMRALRNIDVAFVCMNLPYTMPPNEAAEAVKAFHPAVVYPYHYRGSDLKVFEEGLKGAGIEVRIRDWYAN
jgi:L-ascorbate metabolism protein UlaG (beta-lactamase superfamily)